MKHHLPSRLIQLLRCSKCLPVLLALAASLSTRVPAAPVPALQDASAEWRMAGANAGHTRSVSFTPTIPLHQAWKVTPEKLGAPHGQAGLHVRAIAGGVALLEMDSPASVALVALDLQTGRMKWQRSFPSRQFFPTAGLFPVVTPAGVCVYLTQDNAASPYQWNLSCLDLADGHVRWGCGPLSLGAALSARNTQTLFRPVVNAGSRLLITPDFFGRPPLVAFAANGAGILWRSDRAGGDLPAVDDHPSGSPLVLTVDYAAGRPVLQALSVRSGLMAGAVTGPAVGQGPDWTQGIWDAQIRWVDPASQTCCVSMERLRKDSNWPGASCVLGLPDAAPVHWASLEQGALEGPVLGGELFLGGLVSYAGHKKTPAIWSMETKTGHTRWATHGADAGVPLVATPGLILGKTMAGELAAWSTAAGKLLFRSERSGLQECIAGDGWVVAAWAGRAGPWVAAYH